MFWTIAGIVLAVVLIGAWLYDRKHGGLALTDRDRNGYTRATHDQAHADAAITERNVGTGGGL